MVLIELHPKNSQYSRFSIDVTGECATVNEEKLEESFRREGMRRSDGDSESKIVVTDSKGRTVVLKESKVNPELKHYFDLVPYTSSEIPPSKTTSDGVLESLPDGEAFRIAATNLMETKGLRGDALLQAAIDGYCGAQQGVDPAMIYPDTNKGVRDAYSSGREAQISRSYCLAYMKELENNGIVDEGGVTHADLAKFRHELFLWSFELGKAKTKSKVDEVLPSIAEMRQAFKRGKEAVCIGISDEHWDQIDYETFLICAVPPEYAEYKGGVHEKAVSEASRREILRRLFVFGVDTAWKARKGGSVTRVASRDVVPQEPSYLDAFVDGARAQSLMLLNCAEGTSLDTSDDQQVINVEGLDSPSFIETVNRADQTYAFRDGLQSKWDGYNKKTWPKPDALYPDTNEERREMFIFGRRQRSADDKNREKAIAAEKAEKEEEEANRPKSCGEKVEGTVMSCLKDCKGMCWPLVTRDQNDRTLVCGTNSGDWAIILLLFGIYYTFLGMWYWAFIEILLVVAEPQRPW